MSFRPRRRIAPLLALAIVLTSAIPATAETWEEVVPITASGEAAAWGGSTAVYSGGIAVAYREYEPVGDRHRVRVKRSTDDGATWMGHTSVSSHTVPLATGPALVGSGSNLHIVFVEYRTDGSARVVYRRSANGGETWQPALVLSQAAARPGLPSIARSGQRVIVAWTNELTGTVSTRVSTDGGVTFRARTDVATSSNQPWLDQSNDSYDAFPTVAISSGVLNVAYYTSEGTLRLRRSSSNGSTWTTAVTLANNGNGYLPTLVASGNTIVLGYAIYTGSDIWSAFRRSTNKGQTWSTAAAISGRTAAPSYQPVISVRGGTWRVAFERCLTDDCLQSDVWYREGPTGAFWSTASRATNGPNDFQGPVGVTFTDAIVLTYMTFDPASGEFDILSRRGS